MVSCGGSKQEPKIASSPEMDDFMSMLKGSSDNVASAVTKYAVDSLKNNDIIMYDLKEPVITQADGSCYTVEAKSGATTRIYKLCWTDKKITSIQALGMK